MSRESFCRALLACAVASAAAMPAHALEAPRLRDFLRKATRVVSATAVEVREHDDGRLAVARLEVGATLRARAGAAAGEPAEVIEMRDLARPPVFEQGARGIAFLRAARRNSYLAKHLAGRAYDELVDARSAWLVADSEADLKAMSEIVTALVASSSGAVTDTTKRAAGTRQLVFQLIGARHPLLVEDGADSLEAVPGLAASLSDAERGVLAAAIDRDDLVVRVRQRLIDAVAENDLRQMIPTLQNLRAAELQETCWRALRKLGAPLSDEDIERSLGDAQAATRIAALRELLEREPTAGIARVAPLATGDPDTAVRLAAIEALGKTKSTAAVAPLETVFAADDVELRQASARALLEIGGEPAAEAFYRLAFKGSIDAQRFAVFALLSTGIAKDDPRVRRIEETHKDEKIVDLLKHGLKHEH